MTEKNNEPISVKATWQQSFSFRSTVFLLHIIVISLSRSASLPSFPHCVRSSQQLHPTHTHTHTPSHFPLSLSLHVNKDDVTYCWLWLRQARADTRTHTHTLNWRCSAPFCRRVADLGFLPSMTRLLSCLSADYLGQFSLKHVAFMTRSMRRAMSVNFPKLEKRKEKNEFDVQMENRDLALLFCFLPEDGTWPYSLLWEENKRVLTEKWQRQVTIFFLSVSVILWYAIRSHINVSAIIRPHHLIILNHFSHSQRSEWQYWLESLSCSTPSQTGRTGEMRAEDSSPSSRRPSARCTGWRRESAHPQPERCRLDWQRCCCCCAAALLITGPTGFAWLELRGSRWGWPLRPTPPLCAHSPVDKKN